MPSEGGGGGGALDKDAWLLVAAERCKLAEEAEGRARERK